MGWRRVFGRDGDRAVEVVATERTGQIAVATQRDLVVEFAVDVVHLNALPLLKHLRMLAVAALSISCRRFGRVVFSYKPRNEDPNCRSRVSSLIYR